MVSKSSFIFETTVKLQCIYDWCMT